MKTISKLETNDFTSRIMHSVLKSLLLIESQEINVSLKPVERELIHFSTCLINHGHYKPKNKKKKMHHLSKPY